VKTLDSTFIHVEGIFEIASFRFVPWGNSYFGGIDGDTEYCLTSSKAGCNSKNGLMIWLDHCGAAAPRPVPDECWTGAAPSNGALCQYGEKECKANLIESCAMDVIEKEQRLAGRSDSKPEFWKFIYCYANYTTPEDPRNDPMLPVQTLSNCEHHLTRDDVLAVKDCYSDTTVNSIGRQLQIDAANATASLSPGFTQIPWITVDGTPVSTPDQVLDKVCSSYHGPNKKPAACQPKIG
jgi:hypothetical protein